ncbi:GNAT family N-acetyltransferase [Kitasatospora sp. NPDC049285]|uniref:GNAT family N-acetyltransferase n=1 Tax=Kitasatospora sp. NPDC049285 TaxID=3157096 RepID=UPI003416DC45
MTEQEFSPAVELAGWGWEQVHALGGGVADPFETGTTNLVWRPKEQHYGVRSGDRVVAHAGYVVVPVEVGGVRFDVAGIGGVIVSPDVRGQGLARTAVDAALAGARAAGLDLALLFCLPDRASLYRRLGWTPITEPVTVEQPAGPTVMPIHAMWTAVTPGGSWPGGPVRLHSLPM